MEKRTTALKQKLSTLPIVDPVRASINDPVGQVLKRIGERNDASALVLDGPELAGIFTSRDLVTKVLAGDPDPAAPVREFMTPDPVSVTHDTSIGDAVEIMHEKGFRNLPFRKSDGTWCLLTVRGVIKYLAAHYPEEVYNLPPKLDQIPKTVEGG